MRSIKELKKIEGKTVLLRVDFNVPVKNGKVQDDFRIRKALPTIKFLQKKKARVILIAHLGKGGDTLAPVAKSLNKLVKITFVPDVTGIKAKSAVVKMKPGEVILLENLRNHPGEKKASKIFAKELASFGDIYVNEAFSVDHREDASIVLLPKFLPAYAGFQLEEEVKNLSHAFKNPKRSFLFILGGAKFSTKMPLIKKYLKVADYVFIGGALANDFLKADGYIVGSSLVDDARYNVRELLRSKKLILPIDVVVKSNGALVNKRVEEVGVDDYILDIGDETVKKLAPIIKKSKLVLWNGPLGKYEDGGKKSTKKILKMVASSKAESIIGGGDTVALVSKLKLGNKFSFVSTGGGATLDFLANGTLAGIKALRR